MRLCDCVNQVSLQYSIHMTLKALIHQFKFVFDRSPWYGESVMTKLAGITAEEAFYKPKPEVHSIYEVVQHMLAWRIYALHILEGDLEYDIEVNSHKDWSVLPQASQEAWADLVASLKSNQTHLLRKLAEADDELLTETVPRREFTYDHMLQGIIHHDIYHLGQIALLKKLIK